MRRIFKNASLLAVASLSVMSMSLVLSPTAPVLALENDPPQISQEAETRLEEFVIAYTNVYFALGVCDGFISPQEEAPFDPFGPMLSKWPDSFKRQMIETREEGRLEGLRLARVHRFSRPERAELCRRQMDSSKADLDRLRAQYLK